jgi:hypothetical protein
MVSPLTAHPTLVCSGGRVGFPGGTWMFCGAHLLWQLGREDGYPLNAGRIREESGVVLGRLGHAAGEVGFAAHQAREDVEDAER